MAHTPGPWHVEGKDVGYCVYNFEGKAIASWLSKTDAQLIAAAPELFDALMAMLRDHNSRGCLCDLCGDAAHVLARAEGHRAHRESASRP